MPGGIVLLVFALGILGLFLLDRDPRSRVSPAVWVPVIWMALAGSRMLSQWQVPAPVLESSEHLEGTLVDRLIMTGLLAAGVMVLLARRRRVTAFLRANGPILLFFLYCAASVLWSVYPDVAFKRWTKAVGNVVMVLVVLTDDNPGAAVKRFLGRTGFLLIPVSVMLIKYFPEMGRGYDRWTWTPYYSGVALGKNGLGYVCLVFGLAALWRLIQEFRGRDLAGRPGPLIAHGTALAMTLWLFWKADSATSFTCFLIGGGLLVVTSLPAFGRTPTAVYLLIGGIVGLALFGLFLGGGSDLVEAMGRDPTLTGRTALWDKLLQLTVDPLFGAGFESFWLDEGVEKFRRGYWWHPNQSHNGYLEIFLNLGWMGVALLGLVMVWGYRKVVGDFCRDPDWGRLAVAYFTAAAVYNLTEAAFKGIHVVWIAFLLAVIVVPAPSGREGG